MKLNIFIGLLFLLISSCVKKIDGPITQVLSPYPSIEINMNYPTYSDKVYYSLASKSVIKTSKSRDWYIGFTSLASHPKVILNYALGQSCNGFTLNDTNFNRPISEDDFELNTLYFANHYDSFATLLENAHTDNKVYYLNFGEFGNKLKFKVVSYSSSNVKIRYARLDGSNEKTIDIPIDNLKNYTCFSFSDHQVKDIEPDKSTWDLEFTRYTTLVTEFNTTRMYDVSGVLTNPSKNVIIARLDDKYIDNADSSKLTSYSYESKIGTIGYNWKKFSGQTTDGFYSIPTRTYVINSTGKYYAIQFIEYAKPVKGMLTKGYPSFLQRDF